MKALSAVAVCLLAAGAVRPAMAVDKDDDRVLAPGTVGIAIPSELQSDWTARSRPGGDRVNLTTKIEPEITFQATEEMSFLLGVTFEQAQTPDRGRDEAFEHHALYIKTLTANYESGPLALYMGKFTANFGRAWETGPGIYGNRFAKDYEFAERWGLGGEVALDETPLGDLAFSASLFMVDRTALSDSVLFRRGRTSEGDGGPGNTDSPRSFAVALDGSHLPLLDTLEYHLAYTQQAKGEGDTATMRGVVAGAQLTLPVVGALEATPLVEWASFDNFGGTRGEDRTVWTAALKLEHGPWQAVAAYAKRELSDASGLDESDRSLQLSAGYSFSNGLLAEIAWWRVEDASETDDIVGVRLSYEFGTQFRLY